jgi:hypothetical protein
MRRGTRPDPNPARSRACGRSGCWRGLRRHNDHRNRRARGNFSCCPAA